MREIMTAPMHEKTSTHQITAEALEECSLGMPKMMEALEDPDGIKEKPVRKLKAPSDDPDARHDLQSLNRMVQQNEAVWHEEDRELKAPPEAEEPELDRDLELKALNDLVEGDAAARGSSLEDLKDDFEKKDPELEKQLFDGIVRDVERQALLKNEAEEFFGEGFRPSAEDVAKITQPVTIEYINSSEEEKAQADVKWAMESKQKYYLATIAFQKQGVVNANDAQTIAMAPYIGEELLRSKTYVTDIASGFSEVLSCHGFVDRFQNNPQEISDQIQYFTEIIRELDLPEMAELPMSDILDDLNEFCDGKSIYSRKGLESITDILDDGLIAQHIIERRSVRLLLTDTEHRIELQRKGFHFPEQPDTDAAWELDKVLSKMNPEDQAAIISQFEKNKVQTIENYLKLRLAIDYFIKSNELRVCDFQSPDDLPIEMKILLAENPQLSSDIEELEAQGISLSLRRRKNTDHKVVEAIQNIAVLSQHSYTETWLRDFITEGKRPLLKISENGKAKMEQMEKDGKIVDLEADLDMIKEAASKYLELVSFGELTQEQAKMLERINTGFMGLNNDWAANRMQFDLSDEQSHEAQAMLKKMIVLGPLAHGLEHFNLGYIAKFITGTGIDIGNEVTEIAALKGAGLLQGKKELINRLLPLMPVFVGASGLSILSEKLLEENKTGAGGLAFGVSAAALSLATSIMSMKMYKNNYMELVKEGKIAKSFIAQNAEFKALWKEFSSDMEDLDDPEAMKELLVKTVESMKETVFDSETKQHLIEELQGMDFGQMEKEMKKNVHKEGWKEAIAQDFKNPLRLGVLFGSLAVPVLGGAIGQFYPDGMHEGVVLAALGTVENLMAGVTMVTARSLNGMSYNRKLRRRLEEATGVEAVETTMAPQFA